MVQDVEAGSITPLEAVDKTYQPTIVQGEGYLEFTIAARFEMYGRSQMALDIEGKAIRTFKRSNYNPVLVNALVKSYRWNRQLDSGQVTITDLAKQERRDRTYISRMVKAPYYAAICKCQSQLGDVFNIMAIAMIIKCEAWRATSISAPFQNGPSLFVKSCRVKAISAIYQIR